MALSSSYAPPRPPSRSASACCAGANSTHRTAGIGSGRRALSARTFGESRAISTSEIPIWPLRSIRDPNLAPSLDSRSQSGPFPRLSDSRVRVRPSQVCKRRSHRSKWRRHRRPSVALRRVRAQLLGLHRRRVRPGVHACLCWPLVASGGLWLASDGLWFPDDLSRPLCTTRCL